MVPKHRQTHQSHKMRSTERNPNSTVYPMDIFPAVAASAAHPMISQDEQSPVPMGKVIRVRPNIYIFVCDYCQCEHKSIDSFLRHSEGHFQRGSTPGTTTARSQRATTQIHSDCLMPDAIVNSDGHVPFNGYPLYQSPSSTEHTMDITANPARDSDDYIEEVYEIIDLGYDPDGNKYPMAEKAAVVSTTTNGNANQRLNDGNPTKTYGNKTISCPFCGKMYKNDGSLRRHKVNVHTDILSKLTTLKNSFKCSLCDKKFPRTNKTAAEHHMIKHFKQNSAATKKTPKK